MISVCMATYNGEKYLKEQIDSILVQLAPQDELIISDDGSTDKTLEIIKSYKDNRITLLEGNSFHSPILNFENALKQSKGSYIFLSDQDDIWYEDKVKTVMPLLERYDCVVSDATVIAADRTLIADSFFRLNHSGPGLLRNIIKNGYLGCCMAFNRMILEKALPIPNSIPMHDTWIGLVSEKYGKPLFLKEALIYYRRHGANASSTTERSKRSLKSKIADRFIFMKNIIAR